MSDLRPHELASPFFRLSPEIRLAIYNCLVPRERMYIDLCSLKAPTGDGLMGKRRGIISNLALQTLNINSLTRGNGLHLLVSYCYTLSEYHILLQIVRREDDRIRSRCGLCCRPLLNRPIGELRTVHGLSRAYDAFSTEL
jgi:hypothetical protein